MESKLCDISGNDNQITNAIQNMISGDNPNRNKIETLKFITTEEPETRKDMFMETTIETAQTDMDVTENAPTSPYETIPFGMFIVDRYLIEKTGSLSAGILLSQVIEILKEYSGITYNNHNWVSYTKKQWFNTTGLTTDLFDRAIKRLEKGGFVETKKININGRLFVLIRPTGSDEECDAYYKFNKIYCEPEW